MIEQVKNDHWQDFLQGLDKRTMWTAHKYASGEPSDGVRARMPPLKNML